MRLLALWKSLTAIIERMELQSADIRRTVYAFELLSQMGSERDQLLVAVLPPSSTRTSATDTGDSTADNITVSIVIIQKSDAIEDIDVALMAAERIDDAMLRVSQVEGYAILSTELLVVESPEQYAELGIAPFALSVNFAKQTRI